MTLLSIPADIKRLRSVVSKYFLISLNYRLCSGFQGN